MRSILSTIAVIRKLLEENPSWEAGYGLPYAAFYGCNNLETITFKGTEAQWNAITKGTDWDSGAGQSTSDRKYKLVFEK